MDETFIHMREREAARRKIHAWIKEDLPLGVKMMLVMPLVEKLLDRLYPI